MFEPRDLYDLELDLAEIPPGLPLVAGLTGFADAGNAVTRMTDHLLATTTSQPIAVFDNEALLDYRARRPTVFFDLDHLSEYRTPKLGLYLMTDELHRPYLLLAGYEPDFAWETFTAAILGLIDELGVATATWVHAIPMPVPHTRPLGVTVSGNRTELIAAMSMWKPRTQAPANALHLLEYRLCELGLPTVGFVLLIPHYLAETEYPAAAVSALDSVSAATGLIFAAEGLRDDDREFISKINAQIVGNGELARLVGSLEERYDSYVGSNPLKSPLTDIDGELPTADEIAAELEKFLAAHRQGDDDSPAGEI